jgi:plastocyanin
MTVLRRRRFMPIAVLIAALVLVSGLMIGFGSPTKAQEEESHPAHIHDGTCGSGLGAVVYPLDNVGGGTMMGTPVTGQMMGATDAIPVQTSTTVIQTTLQELTSKPYALNVHESAANIQNYIACGNVGGMVMGSDLAIGLAELNNSGYSGIAFLHDNGDGTTTVIVGLTEAAAETGGGEASPVATPAASPAANTQAGATAQAVSIKNFAFDPPTLTVPVGTTVTWTNNDSTAHTATADDGSFQSGHIDPGQTFSFTFNTAGTFNYHCEIHPNMTASITVQ